VSAGDVEDFQPRVYCAEGCLSVRSQHGEKCAAWGEEGFYSEQWIVSNLKSHIQNDSGTHSVMVLSELNKHSVKSEKLRQLFNENHSIKVQCCLELEKDSTLLNLVKVTSFCTQIPIILVYSRLVLLYYSNRSPIWHSLPTSDTSTVPIRTYSSDISPASTRMKAKRNTNWTHWCHYLHDCPRWRKGRDRF